MSVILLALGILVAAAGLAAVGFGIPISDIAFGGTLIAAGATALSGGLILIALSAVVSELARVTEGLRARPTARVPLRAAEATEPLPAPAAPPPVQPAIGGGGRSLQEPIPSPAPRSRPEAAAIREIRTSESPPSPMPTSSVEVSAAAIERLRSSIPRTERGRPEISPIAAGEEEAPLSPNGATQAAPRRVSAENRPAGAQGEDLRSSRLDFLLRSKAGRPTPEAEKFDSMWPPEGRAGRNAPQAPEPRPKAEGAEPEVDAATLDQERPPEPPPSEERHSPVILKSGVVDGMAYTLYADGSIEAKLPQGTVRFGSIAELRAHIESNS